MGYTLSEKKVLKKLGIPDFRHMTKDKIVKFVSMLPKMEPEVAKAALEQFPEFAGMAKEIVSQYTDIVNNVLKEDGNRHKAFIDACNTILQTLQEELRDEQIDKEERSRIEDKMIEVAKLIRDKDKEDKAFALKIVAGVGSVVVIAVLAGASAIGSKIGVLTSLIGKDNSEDNYIDVDGVDVDEEDEEEKEEEY